MPVFKQSGESVLDFSLLKKGDESGKPIQLNIHEGMVKTVSSLPNSVFGEGNRQAFNSAMAEWLASNKTLVGIAKKGEFELTPEILLGLSNNVFTALQDFKSGTSNYKSIGGCVESAFCFSIAKLANPAEFSGMPVEKFSSMSVSEIDSKTYKGASSDIGAFSREAVAQGLKVIGEIAFAGKAKENSKAAAEFNLHMRNVIALLEADRISKGSKSQREETTAFVEKAKKERNSEFYA